VFHSHGNWYWERLADGSVHVTQRGPHPVFGKGEIVAEHTVTPDVWASIVASVSAAGEECGRFFVAQAFHRTRCGACRDSGYTVDDSYCACKTATEMREQAIALRKELYPWTR
jgi:hypothetical protein